MWWIRRGWRWIGWSMGMCIVDVCDPHEYTLKCTIHRRSLELGLPPPSYFRSHVTHNFLPVPMSATTRTQYKFASMPPFSVSLGIPQPTFHRHDYSYLHPHNENLHPIFPGCQHIREHHQPQSLTTEQPDGVDWINNSLC
jgi:hypothetical protein